MALVKELSRKPEPSMPVGATARISSTLHLLVVRNSRRPADCCPADYRGGGTSVNDRREYRVQMVLCRRERTGGVLRRQDYWAV
jgi:hypothetical protein